MNHIISDCDSGNINIPIERYNMNKVSELAKKIIDYSCEIKKNQKVVIQVIGESSKPLVIALISEIKRVEASVEIINREPSATAEIMKGLTIRKAEQMAKKDLSTILDADVCIMIKSIENENIIGEVPLEKREIYARHYRKVIDEAILENTRWISLRYPNKRMAEEAGMSYVDYEDYFFQVCNMDYNELSGAMLYLVELMSNTSEVRITGPNTDISFSIKGIPVHQCDGLINLPDGEVYTAPIRDSVKGFIEYNVPTIYQGTEFAKVSLEFEAGKIIKAKCENLEHQKTLESIFDMDEGSRYIGEFALGVNPHIIRPTKDILFDEKIAGSFHLTPGFSYKDAFNGNESAIHWDLVCIQTEEYGGGEIYFDGVLVRKDGRFLIEELRILNPK